MRKYDVEGKVNLRRLADNFCTDAIEMSTIDRKDEREGNSSFRCGCPLLYTLKYANLIDNTVPEPPRSKSGHRKSNF